MRSVSASRCRSFVRRHTVLAPVDRVPGIQLHQGDDVTTLLRLTGDTLGTHDPPLPYWAFAWPGGLALARYLGDHPADVAGRRVIDMASGSGLCAIVAARCGASSVVAVDIDPFAEAAITLNARANGVHVAVRLENVLDRDPPACDVILAGDVWYEPSMASRLQPWLEHAARRGTRVLIGDPGRTYLPRGLAFLATYDVRASAEIEGAETRPSTVYDWTEGTARLPSPYATEPPASATPAVPVRRHRRSEGTPRGARRGPQPDRN